MQTEPNTSGGGVVDTKMIGVLLDNIYINKVHIQELNKK